MSTPAAAEPLVDIGEKTGPLGGAGPAIAIILIAAAIGMAGIFWITRDGRGDD